MENWATLVVQRVRGGRCVVVNSSRRNLWKMGDRYFNHQLKVYPQGSVLNVTVRLSRKGRRMVQDVKVKWLPPLLFIAEW